MRSTGNTIFMTGGTSGIGLELARRLRDLGNTVIISGRRQDLLDELDLEGVYLDVADPASIEAARDTVLAKHPEVNVLITMAGIMRAEDLGAPDLPTIEQTIDINLLGTIRTITAFTPQLVERAGVVMTVSSGLAFVPLALTPTYNATKAAVHSYTQSLRHQLAGKVQVVELVPPAVQTALLNDSPDPTWMPLDEYADEVIAALRTNPDADEILVDRVRFFRDAEREHRYQDTFGILNSVG